MFTPIVRPRGLFAAALMLYGGSALAEPLTLTEAERLAAGNDPQAARFEALAGAWEEQAVAESQLPDPRLKFGLQSFPTDTFDRDQEAMTQIQVGVVQEFLRGDTLTLRGRQNEVQAAVERSRGADQERRRLRSVRDAYLETWYQAAAVRLLGTSRDAFAQLVAITRNQYAAGRDAQADVLRARLEFSLLEDRITRAEVDEAVARAELARWVGGAAQQPLPAELPRLAPLPAREALGERLAAHPLLSAEAAQVQAGAVGVDLAEQAYRPGVSLDVTYGERADRPDLLSAMVVLDVPLFTDKRQDRRLAASQRRLDAARLGRDERLLELRRQLDVAYARWRLLGERETRFAEAVLPEAQQTARAARNAYQSRAGEFAGVVRAVVAELDARLQALRVRADRAKAHAELLYLAGEGE